MSGFSLISLETVLLWHSYKVFGYCPFASSYDMFRTTSVNQFQGTTNFAQPGNGFQNDLVATELEQVRLLLEDIRDICGGTIGTATGCSKSTP